jgi:hypothetical protein
MEMRNIQLGGTYRDRITGFQGVATGYVSYITGCSQALLAPPVSQDGAVRESNWFDEQRLEQVGEELILLDNGDTPGFDKAAPKR